MKIYYSIAFCLFVNILTSCGPNKAVTPVKGTRFVLELPNEFKEDRKLPGFISEIDSSIIFISEIENPYSFEELIQKRISNALSLGFDTINFIRSTYDGYKSVQFNTYDLVSNQKGFTINFGSDEFLIDISIETSSDRLEELKRIVLNGKYYKHLEINYEDLLGFTVSYEGSNQKVKKKDANTINTIEKDAFDIIVSWLNLTRMPKSIYEGFTAEDAISATYSHYYDDKSFVSTDSLVIDNSMLLWNVYMKDHITYQEYNIIGIVQKKEFDLLIMGGVNSKEKLGEIYGIIKSIKFKNSR